MYGLYLGRGIYNDKNILVFDISYWDDIVYGI